MWSFPSPKYHEVMSQRKLFRRHNYPAQTLLTARTSSHQKILGRKRLGARTPRCQDVGAKMLKSCVSYDSKIFFCEYFSYQTIHISRKWFFYAMVFLVFSGNSASKMSVLGTRLYIYIKLLPKIIKVALAHGVWMHRNCFMLVYKS